MVTIRVMLLGSELVGKTSLVVCLTTRLFPRDSLPTVFDSFSTQLRLGERTVVLNVWDTASQEEHRLSVRQFYYPLADIFLICFSIGDPSSFERVWADWYREVRQHRPNVPVLLVGTKKDLRQDQAAASAAAAAAAATGQRQAAPVSYQQGARLARRMRAVKYLECSALQREGVGEVFEEAARAVLRGGRSKRTRACVLT